MRQKGSLKRKAENIVSRNKRCITTEDGEDFVVDVDVLSTKSDFFKKLFQRHFEQNLLVRGITSKDMRIIIDFHERKWVNITSENVLNLLMASDYLLVDEFLQKIRLSFSDLICDENCILLYHETLKLEHLDIFKVVLLYMRINFQSVIAESNIGDLSLKDFQQLISDVNLNVTTEEIVWDAIIKWVETDKSRYEFVLSLLRCMKLEVCDNTFMDKILSHPIIENNEIFNDIAALRRLRSSKNNRNLKDRITKRLLGPLAACPRQIQRLLCHVTYDWTRYKCGEIKISIGTTEGNSKPIEISSKRSVAPKFVSSRGTKIYIYDFKSSDFLAFDLVKTKWIHIPLVPADIEEIDLCLVNDCIFAIAIQYDPLPCITVNVYDAQSNNWLKRSLRLSLPRFDYHWIETATLEGLIYVAITGDPFLISESLCARAIGRIFNPETDRWSPFTLPSPPDDDWDIFCSMESYRGALYFSYALQPPEIYRFDPKQDTEWHPFLAIQISDIIRHAVVHEDTLIMRGYDFWCMYWNEELNQWSPFSGKSVVTCEVQDAGVLWKFQNEIWKQEWNDSAKGKIK